MKSKQRAKPGEKWGTRYPWPAWFAKGRVALKRGRDYHCRTDVFIAQVRNRLREDGIAAEIGIAEDLSGIVLTVKGKR